MDKLSHNLPESIGKPAIRALLAVNIISLEQVSKLSDAELLSLHGVGPKAVRILREAAEGF
jgi:ERCC4-type nuclease